MSEAEIQALVNAGKLPEAAELAKNQAINSLLSAALIYSRMGDHQAIDLASQCVALDRHNPKLWGNLSYFLGSAMKCEEAIAAIDQAILLHPIAEFFYNKAVLLASLRRVAEACDNYEAGLNLDPTCHVAKFNLGCMYMSSGKFKEGLPLLEVRFLYDQELIKFRKRFNKPDWTGQDLTGKKLLIFSEQGIGDVLQYIRYVPLLRPAYLIAELQEALVPLVSQFFDTTIGRTDDYNIESDPNFPEYDYVVSFSSLPYLLDHELRSIPKTPYLSATGGEYPIDKTKLNIGISWAGNSINPNDVNRSCFAKDLLPLSKIPNVQLYSLQKLQNGSLKRNRDEKIVDLAEGVNELNLIDWTNQLTDFHKTAQLVNELDLVVSVCTSVAHLAGAMGKPTLLGLSYCHDQRWMLGSDKSHWYNSMQVFTQKTHGDWPGVFTEMADWIKSSLPKSQS